MQTPKINPYLDTIYAPVRDELTIDELEVIGEIPEDLTGMYVRNSPNPRFEPPGRYHWFDGDGMLHGVAFQGGKATYRNRYVQTQAFQVEDERGEAVWGGILDPAQMGLPGPWGGGGRYYTRCVFLAGEGPAAAIARGPMRGNACGGMRRWV